MPIPVVVQYRHVHLSEQDFRLLFGDAELCSETDLGHYGQFVSSMSVEVRGKNGCFEHVRVLGPFREQTQIELSASDVAAIGIRAPLRISGDLVRAGSCMIKGPCGSMHARARVLIPARHLHLNVQAAKQLGVAHSDLTRLRSTHHPSQLIDHVTVRVHPTFANEFHLSVDEAAHYWIQTGHEMTVCDT